MIVRVPAPLRTFLQSLAEAIEHADVVPEVGDDLVRTDRARGGFNGRDYDGVFLTDDGGRWTFTLTRGDVERIARGESVEMTVDAVPPPAGGSPKANLDLALQKLLADEEDEAVDDEPTTPPSAAVGLVNSLVGEGLLELAPGADVERFASGLAACFDRQLGRRGILAYLQASPDVEEHYLSDDDLEGLIERW